jgi:hypothetical protein
VPVLKPMSAAVSGMLFLKVRRTAQILQVPVPCSEKTALHFRALLLALQGYVFVWWAVQGRMHKSLITLKTQDAESFQR